MYNRSLSCIHRKDETGGALAYTAAHNLNKKVNPVFYQPDGFT
jgi:hypothetical protein